ncbi:MAG: aminoacyl-tRNA hydrolase [Firmicutes bacterium]|nr:aminoacyl-tRNA hydrolase [Bacillota bacterium]
MKLIAGLGNPGLRYAGTRHNCGFLTLDQIAGKLSVDFHKKEHNNLTTAAFWHGEKVLLAKPQSYMNASGVPLYALASYYHIELADILIISDDLDLPPAAMRLKRGGRDGGHNGWKSIIGQFASTEINRIKIGVGKAPFSTADYVLSRFSAGEAPYFAKTFATAAEASLYWLENGIGAAMNQYNGMDLAVPAIEEE